MTETDRTRDYVELRLAVQNQTIRLYDRHMDFRIDDRTMRLSGKWMLLANGHWKQSGEPEKSGGTPRQVTPKEQIVEIPVERPMNTPITIQAKPVQSDKPAFGPTGLPLIDGKFAPPSESRMMKPNVIARLDPLQIRIKGQPLAETSYKDRVVVRWRIEGYGDNPNVPLERPVAAEISAKDIRVQLRSVRVQAIFAIRSPSVLDGDDRSIAETDWLAMPIQNGGQYEIRYDLEPKGVQLLQKEANVDAQKPSVAVALPESSGSSSKLAGSNPNLNQIKRTIHFTGPKVLQDFLPSEGCRIVTGNLVLTETNAWDEEKGQMPGAKAIYRAWFNSLESVSMKIKIVGSKDEMGFCVGPINGVLNHDDGKNYFRVGPKPPPRDGKASFELHVATRTPSALTPGRFHVIEVKRDGDRVTVRIDSVKHYETTAQLQGTICVYPRTGTMVLRELNVEGIIDTSQKVERLSHNNLY
jgi:hypothetical protein